ncbi:hypothetical protein [Xanthomonas fragariae]|uniref:hypothetical protein n=1 Tax=Xanthomonas fragariae TaxID=48664 RepID=UPI0035310E18
MNDHNRENFSNETPDMSRAMSMLDDQVALAGRNYREIEKQAALNETNVFKKKSKGALSFAVETGRDVALWPVWSWRDDLGASQKPIL